MEESTILAAMLATGLPRERVTLALTEGDAVDPWGVPDPTSAPAGGFASVIDRDECGCCGSATIFLVGPAGQFPVGGFSGRL